jgi:hypothetical protein
MVRRFVRDNVHRWRDHDQDQFDQDLQRDHNKVEDQDNQIVPVDLADLVVRVDVIHVAAVQVHHIDLLAPVDLVVQVDLVVLVAADLRDGVEVVVLAVDQVAHPVVAVQLLVHSAKERKSRRSLSRRRRVAKRSTIWKRQYLVA